MTEAERARRNLNPHAEARMAMVIWSDEYAFTQRGGSMDFWDSLSEGRKRQAKELVDEIAAAVSDGRRA